MIFLVVTFSVDRVAGDPGKRSAPFESVKIYPFEQLFWLLRDIKP